MHEITPPDINPERERYPNLPDIYRAALVLLHRISGVPFYPADRTDLPFTVDRYGALQTLEANSDRPNPGRLLPLDQYLVLEVNLGKLFDGSGELITNYDPWFPADVITEPQYTKVSPMTLLGEYHQMMRDLPELRNVPSDLPAQFSRLEMILNRAYQQRIFRLKISVEDHPALEYPVGHGIIPDLIAINHSTSNPNARLSIHRALQNPVALEALEDQQDFTPSFEASEEVSDHLPVEEFDEWSKRGAVSENDGKVETNEFATLPTKPLEFEIVNWADHLKNDWSVVQGDTIISEKKDAATGLPIGINVKGWAQLDLGYDFPHLARKKLSLLLKYLMRILIKAEGLNLEDDDEDGDEDKENPYENLPSDFDSESFQAKQPDQWQAKFFLPEYQLLSSIFYELFRTAQLIEEGTQKPADQRGYSEWLAALYNDPDAVRMNKTGESLMDVPGIATDIPDGDIINDFYLEQLSDPMHDEVLTPEKNYTIYVHPLIWAEIKHYLGSSLDLNQD